MNDFIIRFERIYKKLERNEVKLPEMIQAYRLLKSANIGTNEKLVRMGVGTEQMTYNKMKAALLTFADGIIQTSENQRITPKIKLVKEEPQEILYQNEENDQEYSCNEEERHFECYDYENESDQDGEDVFFQSRFNNKSFSKGQRNQRPARFTNNYQQRKGQLNRRTDSGLPSRCSICQSVLHWARDCQHNKDKNAQSYKKPEAILKLDCMFIDDEALTYMASEAKNIAL